MLLHILNLVKDTKINSQKNLELWKNAIRILFPWEYVSISYDISFQNSNDISWSFFVIFSWRIFKIFLISLHLYQVYWNDVRIREAQNREIHYIRAPPPPRSGLELTSYEIHRSDHSVMLSAKGDNSRFISILFFTCYQRSVP